MQLKDLTDYHIGRTLVIDGLKLRYLGISEISMPTPSSDPLDDRPPTLVPSKCWAFFGEDGRRHFYSMGLKSDMACYECFEGM